MSIVVWPFCDLLTLVWTRTCDPLLTSRVKLHVWPSVHLDLGLNPCMWPFIDLLSGSSHVHELFKAAIRKLHRPARNTSASDKYKYWFGLITTSRASTQHREWMIVWWHHTSSDSLKLRFKSISDRIHQYFLPSLYIYIFTYIKSFNFLFIYCLIYMLFCK